MYYKKEYDEYYDSLASNTESIKTAVVSLNDSIIEVSNQFNSVSLMLGEMRGEFSIEISSSIDGLLDEMTAVKGKIDNELSFAIAYMCNLGTVLVEFKPKDQELDDTQDEYNNEKNKYSSDDVTDGSIDQSTYNTWVHNLSELSKALDNLMDKCEKLRDNCEDDIDAIREFNNSVIDLRLKLAAVAASAGNVNIEDIDNMTIEEKKAYLDNIISNITDKYNEYKKLYDYYTKGYINENCTKQQLYNFVDFYSELLGGIPGFPSANQALDSGNPVTRGNAIVDIITMLNNPEIGVNGKTILQVITDYSNGASWEESGMDELYLRTEVASTRDAFRTNENREELFWNRAAYGSPELKDEIISDFLHVTDVLDKSKDGFLENYNKALNSAMVIKGVRGLKDCLTFDYTYKNANLDNYEVNDHLLYINGFDSEEYSLEEAKMISYLLETEDYDAAHAYLDLRRDSINRRNGMLAADRYYQSLHSGDNVGIDSVVDHIRVGARGYGDGLGTFTDGLIDLVAPDSVMSEHDYETMYFLQTLEGSDDAYDRSLLTDYRITNKLGLYTIPTLVGTLTCGTAGTAVFIASDIGNGIENQKIQTRQAANSYESLVLEEASYSEALVNTAIPYMGSDLPNDITFGIIGMFKNINPILGATLDIAFDEVWHRTVM